MAAELCEQTYDSGLLDEVEQKLLCCCICKNVMEDPVQLACLHSCCGKCYDDAIEKESSGCIKCVSCAGVTDVTCRRRNAFIANQIYASKILREEASCNICNEDGIRENATHWCNSCCKALCDGCIPWHNKFFKRHQDTVSLDYVSVNESSLKVSPLCQLHQMPEDHLCFDCSKPKCISCGKTCLRIKHDVQIIGCPRTDDCVLKIKAEINQFRSAVQSASDLIKSHKKLCKDIQAARLMSLEVLQINKKTILAAVDTAFHAAEESVHEVYDNLDSQASMMASAAYQLEEKSSFASLYSRVLLDAGDVTDLLEQQNLLLAHLRTLRDAMGRLEATTDVSTCVAIKSEIPSGPEEQLQKWIGIPILQKGLVAYTYAPILDEPLAASAIVCAPLDEHLEASSIEYELDEHLEASDIVYARLDEPLVTRPESPIWQPSTPQIPIRHHYRPHRPRRRRNHPLS